MKTNLLRSLWLSVLLLVVGMISAQVTTQVDFNNAVSAAANGSTVEISAAGTYTVPGISNNITVKGTVDGVIFNCVGSGSIASIPNGCTFDNVTFNMGTNNYHGFQHAGTINMNGCTINGKFFSYGDMNFTGCTFNQTASDYCMWDYGKDLTYTNCTFNCNGKFINVYNEGNGNWKLTVEGCTFNSTEKNKAALNIKASCGAKVLGWDVVINECTINDEAMFPSASGDATSRLYVGSPIWQVDDRTAAALEANMVKVALDGEIVYGATSDPVITIPETVTGVTEEVKTAVEALANNENVNAEGTNNVEEVSGVDALKIEVKSVEVESSIITKVTFDVQPMNGETEVDETDQFITFRLPVPQSFTNVIVKVSHNHNGNVEEFSTFVKGEGAAKYVEISSDKFSEWTIEDVLGENIEITTPDDLVALSAYVNAGNNMSGKTVKLANDIDMEGVAFEPISQSNYWFAGVFDGQGNTIKNLTVNTPSTNRAALFGGLSYGTVKDFTLDNPQIQGGADYTAAVCASGNGTILNVTVKGGSVKGTDQVGGIAGFMIATTIKGCTLNGTTIEAAGDRAGGIIGKIDGQNSFHIDNNTLIGVTVKAAAKHGVCGAGGIASQLMTNTVASGMSIKNNEIDVTTITYGVEEFVPIANLRDGYSMDPVNTDNICKNHWVSETVAETTISNGTSSVTFGNFFPVVQIGDERYASLAEAVADATSGQTITLLADIDENVTVAAEKNVIVDLNGHNITVTAAQPAFTNFGTLKIQGEGNVMRADHRGYVIDNQGTIELAGGNYKKTAGTSMNALLRNAGTMTISGGTYYAKYGNSAGTQEDYRADNIYSANSVGMPEGTVSAVSMTGGEFLTSTHGFVATATSSCVVTGGTFATAPHKFFADGYGVEKNAEGKYVTSSGFILTDGTSYYKTVESAYTTATKALSLIADYSGNIEVPAEATINYLYLNNHKVTGNITNNATKALVLGESSVEKATSENGIVTGTLSENIQVTGGKYANDPAANVNKYEFKTSQVGAYYVVVDKTAEEKAAALVADGIKVITGSGSTIAYYTSVQAAEDACAATNYTMTLVADIENEDVVRTKSSATRQYKLGGFCFSGAINTALNGNGATTGVRFGGTGTAVLNSLSATFLSVDLDSYSPNVTIKTGNVSGNVTAKVGYLTIEGGTFTATGTSALAGTVDHLIIKGGTFSVDPTNFVAAGYKAVVNNGVWTVEVIPVVELTVYAGDNSPQTKSLSEFVDIQKTYKNAIAIASSDFATEVASYNNIILDEIDGENHSYSCLNFVLADANGTDNVDFYSPVDFIAVNGSYTRSFNVAGYNSVCLPFAFTANDFTIATAQIYTYTTYNEAENTVEFNQITNAEAAQPCIVILNQTGSQEFTFNNTSIIGSPQSTNNGMCGTFVKTEQFKEGGYSVVASENKFGPLSQFLHPFRACLYLDANKQSAPRLIINGTEEATGIEDVTTGSKFDGQAIYSVLGQYMGTNVDNLPNGMYIIKGEKVMISK